MWSYTVAVLHNMNRTLEKNIASKQDNLFSQKAVAVDLQ